MFETLTVSPGSSCTTVQNHCHGIQPSTAQRKKRNEYVGPCAYRECSVGSNVDVDTKKCSVCCKPVHHMCSNEFYEGELSVRVCSVDCSHQRVQSTGKNGSQSSGAECDESHPASRSGSMAAPPGSVSAERSPHLAATPLENDRALDKRQRGADVASDNDDLDVPVAPLCSGVDNRDLSSRNNDPLAPFDCESFLHAMTVERLLDAPDDDDINVITAENDGEENANDSDPSGSEVDDEGPLAIDEMPTDDWWAEDVEEVCFTEADDFAAAQGYVTRSVLDDLVATGWKAFSPDESRGVWQPAATNLYDGPWGPRRSSIAFAGTPLGMFYYFLPKALWIHIADQSNIYRAQQLPWIAEERHTKMLARKMEDPAVKVKDTTGILDELRKVKDIEPHELLHYVGLLIARVLAPHRDSLRRHSSTAPDGATPAGTFGAYMRRHRFDEISRFLHFNDNSRRCDGKPDRAFKIRSVLQVLEKTFRRGYRLGPRISFDEGMVPNKSRFNPLRVYMAAKPNKWGTKFFLTCCSVTAYCSRVEVYCGADKSQKKPRSKKGDPNAETASVISTIVIRNITEALRGMPAKRLIVTDNYYTLVSLEMKLYSLGYYTVGTGRTNRLGWCRAITHTQAERPKSIARGTYRLATASTLPLVAVSWMDSKPVNFLATGCSLDYGHDGVKTREGRFNHASERSSAGSRLPQEHGGVDVHDQLRLHRYSIQTCVPIRKYYKALFLGLVDMAQ